QRASGDGANAEDTTKPAVAARWRMQVLGDEEIAQAFERAEAQPGQYLGDQHRPQHVVAHHICDPGGEFAREVTRLAWFQATGRRRRDDGEGGPETESK